VTPRGRVDALYASGGGVRNVTLMTALRRRLDGIKVARLDDLGVSPGIKEALAFAFLAHLTLSGEPGNVPGATGARHPVVLGVITPGATVGGSRCWRPAPPEIAAPAEGTRCAELRSSGCSLQARAGCSAVVHR
jgi:hypothetical protein